MARYDYQKTRLLVEARGKVSLSQAEAGDYFGLQYPKGRDAVAAWELGNSAPKAKRRATFISYLWQKLRLKDEPEQMQLIWREVMVGQWKWAKLQDHELPKEPHHQIPEPTSGFRGRADDVDQVVFHLHAAVEERKVAVCGIWGMGGVGKTEFAYEITRQVRQLFPDSQLLLELRGEDRSQLPHEQAFDPLQALKTVIRALTHDRDIPDAQAELVARYRSVLADRRVLILADNARDTAQVRPLVPPAGSALLVTSRMRINLRDIKTVPLSLLDQESAEALLLKICPRLGAYAGELARLCGFLPLALRISASTLEQTPMRHPAAYVEQLRAERLPHLVEPEGNSDDPQASVEASLRLSFDALDDDMQHVMLHLSVFPASFDLDAANAVLQGVPGAANLIEKLYRRSMVEWNAETERYTLHDLVREFCARRLRDVEAVLLRYAQHYASVAARTEYLYANHDLQGALALLDRERTHIDAGWTWARTNAGIPDVDALLIAYGDGTFHVGELRYDKRSERLPQMQAMHAAAQRLGERAAEGRALHYLGNTYYLVGDWAAAARAFEQALPIARELGTVFEEGNLLGNLGLAYWRMDDPDHALKLFMERIRIAKDIGDQRGEAVGLCNIGVVYRERKQLSEALAYLTEYLNLSRAINDLKNESAALTYLADTYRDLGDITQAITHYEQSLTIDRELGDQEGEARASWYLGEIFAQDDPQRALTLMEKAYAYERILGHPIAVQHHRIVEELRRRMSHDQWE